jgi:hypothetical protein
MQLFKVLAYIAIFRIDEMGFKKFRELALTQEPSKMNVFLGYVFNKVCINYFLLDIIILLNTCDRKIYGILIVHHGWKSKI